MRRALARPGLAACACWALAGAAMACAPPQSVRPPADPPRLVRDSAAAGADRSAPMPALAINPVAARSRVADSVRAVIDRAIADSAFPGAYAAVGTAAGSLADYGAGQLDWSPGSPRPDARTLWDLASLTKVVATTSAVLLLVADGQVRLDAPVARYVREWDTPRRRTTTVRHLLSHASGMPSWRPLYKEATTPDSALALALASEPDTAPGARYVYSDLNFITLGVLVARVSGEPLDEFVSAHAFGPLGMRDTRFRPGPGDRARVAPTEFDPWRQRKLRGEVHDENAFALGGVAGHAGLFSTGDDLARLARVYLGGGSGAARRVFADSTVAEFTRVQNAAVSRRALGWETPTGGNSAGHYLSPRSFGHTGFTGTSLWMDPDRGVYVLLLTNRVNPTRMNTKIGRVRVALADAVVQALGGRPAFPPPATTATPAR